MTIIGNIRHSMYDQLTDAILDVLQESPGMVSDIASEIDCSPSTIRNHLADLEVQGRVKRTRMFRKECAGFFYLWSLPETHVQRTYPIQPRPRKAKGDPAPQSPSKARDPLIAALFGSARRAES